MIVVFVLNEKISSSISIGDGKMRPKGNYGRFEVPQRRVKGNLEMERGKPHKQETQILVEELEAQKWMGNGIA